MKVALVFIIPIFYFYMSWFFPWGMFQGDSSISVSYVFDAIFGVLVITAYKQREFIGRVKAKAFGVRASLTGILALIFCFISIKLKFNAPFKYVDYLWLQILILAPIFEELIFRGALFIVMRRSELPKTAILTLCSILFSFSHLPAIWILPQEFHIFIGYQLFYTLFLGWVCSKARYETNGLLEPILLHFIFNLIFFIAVQSFSL